MLNLPQPENRLLRMIYLMIHRYTSHDVGIQSAALAFYLLFTIFPFLIFISALLGVLHLDIAGIQQVLSEFLPSAAANLISFYLAYVSANPSPELMVFALLFSIYFPMRVANAFMRSVRTAYHLGPPRQVMIHFLKSLLFSVVLILVIAVTLVLITVNGWMLAYCVEEFHLPPIIADIWTRLRFPIAGASGFFALFFLYALAQDSIQSIQRWRNIWPGTLAALCAWLGASWLYSFYVDHFSNYSVLYGSIGAVIALMIWLNLTSVVLIMGAEFNGVLISMRKDDYAVKIEKL